MEGAERDPSNPLGRLLENEFYLEKVLEYVIDDGLHECRRVCRKWRDVCGRLPVKLDSNTLFDKVEVLCELFPKASRVTVDELVSHPCAQYIPLASFGHLKQLRVAVKADFTLPIELKSLECLESLRLEVWNCDALADFYSSLQFLTKLSELDLELAETKNDDPPEMEPITQLRNIKKLKLYNAPLLNGKGQFLFHPLPSLTSLAIRFDLSDFSHFDTLQRIPQV